MLVCFRVSKIRVFFFNFPIRKSLVVFEMVISRFCRPLYKTFTWHLNKFNVAIFKKIIFPVAVGLAVKTTLYLNTESNNELEDSIIIITKAWAMDIEVG